MTESQRTKLMAYWWPEAARKMGWNPQDRAKRLEVLSEAVGRPLRSATELDRLTDIDKVKAHLKAISQDTNLTAQVQQANMPRTRLMYSINSFRFAPGYYHDWLANQHWPTDPDLLTLEQLESLRNFLSNRRRSKKGSARTAGPRVFTMPAPSDQSDPVSVPASQMSDDPF